MNDVTLADEDGTQNLLILFMIDDVDEDHDNHEHDKTNPDDNDTGT